MKRVQIPISEEDRYILDTFSTPRIFRAFNRNLRGLSVPVGPFHRSLHDQAIYDTVPSSNFEVSQMANLYSSREPRYRATVLFIEYDEKKDQYYAEVEWNEKEPHPLILRITAILQGKRCIRVLQFGVE